MSCLNLFVLYCIFIFVLLFIIFIRLFIYITFVFLGHLASSNIRPNQGSLGLFLKLNIRPKKKWQQPRKARSAWFFSFELTRVRHPRLHEAPIKHDHPSFVHFSHATIQPTATSFSSFFSYSFFGPSLQLDRTCRAVPCCSRTSLRRRQAPSTFVCDSFTRKSRLGWPPMHVTFSVWRWHVSSPGYSQHPQPMSMMACVPRAEERSCSLLTSKDQPPVCLSSVKEDEL